MAKSKIVYEKGSIPQGSRVVIVVSQGSAPVQPTTFCAMPDVVGKSQGAALEAISRAKLRTKVVYEYHETVRKGAVTAQLPPAESDIAAGSETLVLVSSGQAVNPRLATTLPDVVGMSEVEAIGVLEAAGLSPQVMREYNASVAAGVVASQLPDVLSNGGVEPKSKVGFWVIVAILALALLAGGLYLNHIKATESDPVAAQAVVPTVIGLKLDEATKKIEDAKLVVGTITKVDATSDAPKTGDVASSNPGSGTKVAQGSKVDLEVVKVQASTPVKENITLPDVVGQRENTAIGTLKYKGFSVNVSTKADGDVEKGRVISQTPNAGTSIAAAAEVTIVVSTGPKPVATVGVPDVVGLTKAAAGKLVTAAGLTLNSSTSSSDKVAKGSVISQTPNVGTMVEKGSAVTVIVSTGPDTTSGSNTQSTP